MSKDKSKDCHTQEDQPSPTYGDPANEEHTRRRRLEEQSHPCNHMLYFPKWKSNEFCVLIFIIRYLIYL